MPGTHDRYKWRRGQQSCWHVMKNARACDGQGQFLRRVSCVAGSYSKDCNFAVVRFGQWVPVVSYFTLLY